MKPIEFFIDLVENAVEDKNRDADQLDQWARESRSGGWSTHQVEPMMRKADTLRREASELRRVLKESAVAERVCKRCGLPSNALIHSGRIALDIGGHEFLSPETDSEVGGPS